MPRQCLVIIATVLCLFSLWPAHSKAIGDIKLEVFFDGGNAYFQSKANPKALTVGAVSQGEHAHHFNRHRMKLRLETGSVARTGTTLLAQKHLLAKETGSEKELVTSWDLFGWKVQVCPEGICPSSDTLTFPLGQGSNGKCEDPGHNLSLLPRFDLLHPGIDVVPNWRDRLDSELLLRAGRLVVAEAKNCFEFRLGDDKLVRNVSGARKDVKWEQTALQATYVDLKFEPKFKDVAMHPRTVRLLPSLSGSIQLRVATTIEEYPNPEPTEEIEHFQQFYSLFDSTAIPADKRWRMFAKIISPEATPGTECPPAYFLVP